MSARRSRCRSRRFRRRTEKRQQAAFFEKMIGSKTRTNGEVWWRTGAGLEQACCTMAHSGATPMLKEIGVMVDAYYGTPVAG